MFRMSGPVKFQSLEICLDATSNDWNFAIMFSKGQLIELDITDAADGIKCFGKLDDGIGVFVHGALAVGDRVEAEIFKIKKNYLEAWLRNIIAPAPVRVTPCCAHVGACGGCKWQHVAYAEQLRMKRKMVADALAHIGGFDDVAVDDAIAAPDAFHYRNKVEFSFGDARYLLDEEKNLQGEELAKPRDYALGFHAANLFSKVVDIDRCHIATEEMNVALELAKRFFRERKISVCSNHTHEGFLRNLALRHAAFSGEFMVYLITSSYDEALMKEFLSALLEAFGPKLTTFVNGTTQRKNSVAYADAFHVMHGAGFITEQLGRCHFNISPNSFFQTNSRQALRLYEVTTEAAALKPSDVLHDLYCGTGSIGIFCADACARVVGFELEASSIRDAGANATLNGISNIEFHQIDMKNFGKIASSAPRPDVVITDPPRAGMHENTVAVLRDLAPRRIVYVSCNPASLARDAAALCAGGLYKLTRVQPMDLFPHTLHIESVATLERLTSN